MHKLSAIAACLHGHNDDRVMTDSFNFRARMLKAGDVVIMPASACNAASRQQSQCKRHVRLTAGMRFKLLPGLPVRSRPRVAIPANTASSSELRTDTQSALKKRCSRF